MLLSNHTNMTTNTSLFNDNELSQSNIESQLARLKKEEKYLQTILEIKIRKELMTHLERDQEVEFIKNTSAMNNSLNSQEIDDRNMTTTHLLFHKITNECPICDKNTINGLILSSGNERTLNKSFTSSSIPKFQNKEEIKTKPNVVFSQAYKNARPKYVSNLKSLVQTHVIRDIDSNLRLSYNESSILKKNPENQRAKSTSDLNRSVQFEKGTLDSIARNLTATSNNERDYAKAFRDNHFYGKKDIPRHTAVCTDKPEPKFIQLPLTKTLVHDRAWGYGKNYKQTNTSYYPFRDAKISNLKK